MNPTDDTTKGEARVTCSGEGTPDAAEVTLINQTADPQPPPALPGSSDDSGSNGEPPLEPTDDADEERFVLPLLLEGYQENATTIGAVADDLQAAADKLRRMEEKGVVLSEESVVNKGFLYLATPDPKVAEEFGFELEEKGLPSFNQYAKQPVTVPAFVWDDGETKPFSGFCRGDGPHYVGLEHQCSLGVYTEAGQYFSMVLESGVQCAVPQFYIGDIPFYYPIVLFTTMQAWVDPTTGNLRSWIDPQTGLLMPGSPHTQREGAVTLE